MKHLAKTIELLCIMALIIVFQSCENEPVQTDLGIIEIKDITYNPASERTEPSLQEYPDTVSCILYHYNAALKTLHLTHVNSGFNCCPKAIVAEASFVGDTLVVTEWEEQPLCNCNCLYDLDFTIFNLDKENFILKIIEPYAERLAPLIQQLDLNTLPAGSFCAIRKQYPWDLY
jgi:hypothetical protein